MARPSEVTVLRRLVKAQDRILLSYRVGGPPPGKALDETAKCRRWLLEIRDEALTQGVEAAQAEPASG